MIKNKQTYTPTYAFPVFLNLNNRPCLIVGGGVIAVRKATDLIDAGANVTVIAEAPIDEIEKLTVEKIKQVANTHLIKKNRTIGEIIPE